MVDPKTMTAETGMELLGELHPFAEQLGSPSGLAALTAAALSMQFGPVHNLATLRRFLETYNSQILISCELPTIHKAYSHASRYEIRELIMSDWQLGHEPKLQPFAGVSQCLGTAQLRRLRPLRDQRLVQRYLDAVDHGEAHGWHTVVYGLILFLYSLPLRQGLLNYGWQTLRGFVDYARFSLKLPEEQCERLLSDLSLHLPHAVEAILKNHAPEFA